MRYINISVLLVLTLGFLCFNSKAEHVIDESKTPSYQFVLSGDSGTLKDGVLTLTGIPIVTFYNLGSIRGAGHIFVETFVKVWNNDAVILEKDPPNATLSVLGKDSSKGAVVEISEPDSNLNVITYKAKVLEGSIPEKFGPFTMYVQFNVNGHLKTEQ